MFKNHRCVQLGWPQDAWWSCELSKVAFHSLLYRCALGLCRARDFFPSCVWVVECETMVRLCVSHCSPMNNRSASTEIRRVHSRAYSRGQVAQRNRWYRPPLRHECLGGKTSFVITSFIASEGSRYFFCYYMVCVFSPSSKMISLHMFSGQPNTEPSQPHILRQFNIWPNHFRSTNLYRATIFHHNVDSFQAYITTGHLHHHNTLRLGTSRTTLASDAKPG